MLALKLQCTPRIDQNGNTEVNKHEDVQPTCDYMPEVSTPRSCRICKPMYLEGEGRDCVRKLPQLSIAPLCLASVNVTLTFPASSRSPSDWCLGTSTKWSHQSPVTHSLLARGNQHPHTRRVDSHRGSAKSPTQCPAQHNSEIRKHKDYASLTHKAQILLGYRCRRRCKYRCGCRCMDTCGCRCKVKKV